ncbi:hypothetical protein MKUB_30010 [Mycobacterium kubicae]|uniref:ATP-binding protein n=1 Tax=Mycobacterium kubicae TaxID=120959 RepID=A0ABQ1BP64_9MYCO|nr:hypothetical protein MKUB_30010 [Mycobacterium kubicae]
MRADVRAGIENSGLLISADDDAYYDDEECSQEPVSFGLNGDALSIFFEFTTNTWMAPDRHSDEAAPFRRRDELEDGGEYYDEDAAVAHVLSGVLKTFMMRNGLELCLIELHPQYAYPPWRWRAAATVQVRGKSITDCVALAKDAIALAEAFGQNGNLNRQIAADLVRAGHVSSLLGQPEGHWLEVKRQHFELPGPVGTIRLAEAVAKFANSELGGLIVIGLAAKKIPGGEVIHRHCPVPIDGKTVKRYRQALEFRLYPPPDRLTIEPIGDPGNLGVILIDIPPQPEELKPFLVHGAIVNGAVEGAFISIVRRRGESSIPTTASMIHSTLAAGRALLRRGELRGQNEDFGN